MLQHFSRRLWNFGLIVAACISVLAGNHFATAQDVDSPSVSPVAEVREQPQDDPVNAQKQKQSALAGLLIVGLLAFIGIVLVLVVIVWGKRLRRLNNAPLPKQHPGDPLWYLRTNGQTPDQDLEREDG